MAALKEHLATNKHEKNIRGDIGSSQIDNFFKTTSISNEVKKDEIKMVAVLLEHNIPFRVMDHLSRVLSDAFHDSEMAKKFSCKRTKSTAIAYNVLGRNFGSRKPLQIYTQDSFFPLYSMKALMMKPIRFCNRALSPVKINQSVSEKVNSTEILSIKSSRFYSGSKENILPCNFTLQEQHNKDEDQYKVGKKKPLMKYYRFKILMHLTFLPHGKWNKVMLIPLASDLNLLKNYFVRRANESCDKLQKNNNDINSYMFLLETIYCRLILLNRRRPGELERMTIQSYISAKDNQCYEEFSEAISETERILMKSFKRIVIKGKRGRGVPVLVSKDVQEHLEMITKCRDLLLKTPSIYLFVNPKFDKPIRGFEVMSKYAKLCGAKNPSALTCTRLRKHISTLTQLFTMSENDMEQLALFMGHTLGIHRSSYRLPDDIYQTVKISKLLLLMEKGKADQFKGKSLKEIAINLEEDIVEDDDGHNNEVFGEQKNETNDVIESKGPESCNNEKKGIMDMKAKNKKGVLVSWTENQKKVVKMYFKNPH
ncbi:unnamed protein product [Diabrotica balteata]|uniref:Uncharacterized protein n=1 Tax=Diabrotica balteata TaxID=107213 RepID=A0A9N9XIL7_DIABA|nr:unnamed protein product [Diabrotica balteata]